MHHSHINYLSLVSICPKLYEGPTCPVLVPLHLKEALLKSSYGSRKHCQLPQLDLGQSHSQLCPKVEIANLNIQNPIEFFSFFSARKGKREGSSRAMLATARPSCFQLIFLRVQLLKILTTEILWRSRPGDNHRIDAIATLVRLSLQCPHDISLTKHNNNSFSFTTEPLSR